MEEVDTVGMTHVSLLVDSSGSMRWCKQQTLAGLNQQLDALKEDGEVLKTEVSLTTFAAVKDIKPVFEKVPASKLSRITDRDYEPHGDTALYDAIGYAIDKLHKDTDPNDELNSYLISVISDGDDRCSKKWNPPTALAEWIETLEKTNRWTFTYLGANQNLRAISKVLNIPIANMDSYTADRGGTARAWHTNRSQTKLYMQKRLEGEKSVKDFYSPEAKVEAANIDLRGLLKRSLKRTK